MKIDYLTQVTARVLLSLSLISITWLESMPKSLAQTTDHTDSNKIVFIPAVKQPDPPDKGTTESNEGTGSRGDCPHEPNTLPLTSLVGSNNLTTTISEYPSFWVYIPYSSKQFRTAEFALQNEDQDLYRDLIKLPANVPGIIEIKLPSTISPLKIGQQYRWYLEIDCSTAANQKNLSSDTLTGIVKRIEMPSELKNELKMAPTALEKIRLFAKYGVWHETLTHLAQLRQSEPQSFNYRKLWNSIFNQPDVGLTNIVKEPVLNHNFSR